MSAVERIADRQLCRFRTGRFAAVEHQGVTILIGRRTALARVVLASAAAGAATGYVVAAAAFGLVVPMVVVPLAVVAALAGVITVRRTLLHASAQAVLNGRDRRAHGPIYGATVELGDEPPPSNAGEPHDGRSTDYGAAWRDQAAIGSARPLSPGHAHPLTGSPR